MLSRLTANHLPFAATVESARLAFELLSEPRLSEHLCDEELFALCVDPDPTLTLLNYLLITRRQEQGKFRLRSVSQMHRQAQQLFYTHFDAQKLVDLASDDQVSREVRAAAVAVLDSCTTGGWRFRLGSQAAELGQIAGSIVQQQVDAGQRNRAAESLSAFAAIDQAASESIIEALCPV